MSNSISTRCPPRVIFFGMQSNFSTPSLRALLESDVEVCAVVLPMSFGAPNTSLQRREPPVGQRVAPSLPMVHSPFLMQMAWTRQIPVWEVQCLTDAETLTMLAAYQPDIICVACFSQRLPHVIIDLPRLGCVNVHPSLLPANRGPVPLFWTFYEGHEKAGVTIHFMNEQMDHGDILSQEAFDIPDGISYDVLEGMCGWLGGKLLVHTVWDLYEGRATRIVQDEALSSFHSFPSSDHFTMHPENWTARHLYNFICGVHGWSSLLYLSIGSERFIVHVAYSYSLEELTPSPTKGYQYIEDAQLLVCCRSGWVRIEAIPQLVISG